jgi:hypothetical protein
MAWLAKRRKYDRGDQVMEIPMGSFGRDPEQVGVLKEGIDNKSLEQSP